MEQARWGQVTASPMSLPGVGQQLPPQRGAPGGADTAAVPGAARRAHAAGVRRAGGSPQGEEVALVPLSPAVGCPRPRVAPWSSVSRRSGWWWRTRTGWWWCPTGPPGPSRPCCCPAGTSSACRTCVTARGTVSDPDILPHVPWAQWFWGGRPMGAGGGPVLLFGVTRGAALHALRVLSAWMWSRDVAGASLLLVTGVPPAWGRVVLASWGCDTLPTPPRLGLHHAEAAHQVRQPLPSLLPLLHGLAR